MTDLEFFGDAEPGLALSDAAALCNALAITIDASRVWIGEAAFGLNDCRACGRVYPAAENRWGCCSGRCAAVWRKRKKTALDARAANR